ncbi:transketolase [Candidatus Desantisbacteria bacterium]|nr:transketolase [Candidatus Desantisbacteria bacterium]
MADCSSLEKMANTIRQDIITMLTNSCSGHPGGSLSSADILTVLYFHKMRINSKNPKWPDRDRFVMSKGHAAPVLYASLARAGFFDVSELLTLRKLGSILQGHPDYKLTPGVECSTGSLGQGLSIANGMALAGKLDKKDYRVYALIGDGESQEGQIWEAAMASAHYKLDNLCVIQDFNGLQIDGPVEEVMNVKPLPEKWRSFGFNVQEINGHDISEIISAFDKAEEEKGKPSIIIANTIKGKGVSFMEGQCKYHGTPPTKEEGDKCPVQPNHRFFVISTRLVFLTLV